MSFSALFFRLFDDVEDLRAKLRRRMQDSSRIASLSIIGAVRAWEHGRLRRGGGMGGGRREGRSSESSSYEMSW